MKSTAATGNFQKNILPGDRLPAAGKIFFCQCTMKKIVIRIMRYVRVRAQAPNPKPFQKIHCASVSCIYFPMKIKYFNYYHSTAIYFALCQL